MHLHECAAAFGAGVGFHLLWDVAVVAVAAFTGWKMRGRCSHH